MEADVNKIVRVSEVELHPVNFSVQIERYSVQEDFKSSVLVVNFYNRVHCFFINSVSE